MMNTGALRIVALFVALVFTPTAAFANGSAAEAVAPGIEEASAAPAADKNAEKSFRVVEDHRVLSLRSAIPFPPLRKHTISDGKDMPKTIGYTTEIPGSVEFGVFHISFGEKFYAQHVRGNEMRFIRAYYVLSLIHI